MPFHPFPSSAKANAQGVKSATKQVGELFHPSGTIEVEVLDAAAGQVKLGVRNPAPEPGEGWQGVNIDGPGYFITGKESGPTLVLRRPEGSRIRINDQLQISVLQARGGLVQLAFELLS